MPTLDGADPTFAANVNALLKDTGATLQSGYRSAQEQQALHDAAVKKYGSEQEASKWAAAPGHSNHEHGIAADIGGYQKITDAQLSAHGLYRPLSYEPWHIEPIGSRSKSGLKAYTTPPGVDPAVHKVLANFSDAVANLDVGAAGSDVGSAESTVGATDADLTSTGSEPEQTATPTDATNYSQGVTTGGNSASGSTPASESKYAAQFNAAGAKYGISPKILQEVARQESGFNANAGSGAGAIGLMQFMPGTAKGLGIDPHDADQSIDGAARLLSGYMQQYGGDLSKALAAYNAGPGAVARYGGVPPYKETQQYVNNITSRVNS